MGIAGKPYTFTEKCATCVLMRPRIYKPKYADDGKDTERQARGAKPPTPEKKLRDKSRTRTIFGRKKSISQR